MEVIKDISTYMSDTAAKEIRTSITAALFDLDETVRAESLIKIVSLTGGQFQTAYIGDNQVFVRLRTDEGIVSAYVAGIDKEYGCLPQYACSAPLSRK